MVTGDRVSNDVQDSIRILLRCACTPLDRHRPGVKSMAQYNVYAALHDKCLCTARPSAPQTQCCCDWQDAVSSHQASHLHAVPLHRHTGVPDSAQPLKPCLRTTTFGPAASPCSSEKCRAHFGPRTCQGVREGRHIKKHAGFGIQTLRD